MHERKENKERLVGGCGRKKGNREKRDSKTKESERNGKTLVNFLARHQSLSFAVPE